MKNRIAVGASLAVALLVSGVLAEGALQSGPQVGNSVPAFNPLHVTGPTPGSKQCLVWKNGNNPVAMIFAREVSDPLTSLVKKIDEATAKHNDCRMGSFVVFLSDDEKLEKKLKDVAAKEHIKNTVLTLDNAAGPGGYRIPKDADVTVILYSKKNVKVNYAFKKGELKDKDITQIVADVQKILPQKK